MRYCNSWGRHATPGFRDCLKCRERRLARDGERRYWGKPKTEKPELSKSQKKRRRKRKNAKLRSQGLAL